MPIDASVKSLVVNNIRWLLINTINGLDIARILLALLIVFLFVLTRKIFSKIIEKIVKFIMRKNPTNFSDSLTNSLKTPVRFLFVTVGIWLAVAVLQLPIAYRDFVRNVIRSMVVFSVFWGAYRTTDSMTVLLLQITQNSEKKIDNVLVPFLRKGLKVLVVVIGGTIIAQEWDYQVASLIAGFGLGGLALALAAKDAAANLFGSFMIMADKSFSIGDWIQIGDVEGTVEEIGLRSTKVRSASQALIAIPNATVSNSTILNFSRRDRRTIKFTLGVSYDTTKQQMEKVTKRLKEMLANHPRVHPDFIIVSFQNFGESTLEILVYFFVNTPSYVEQLEINQDINLRIMDILNELGISIAFPARNIYMHTNGTDN